MKNHLVFKCRLDLKIALLHPVPTGTRTKCDRREMVWKEISRTVGGLGGGGLKGVVSGDLGPTRNMHFLN